MRVCGQNGECELFGVHKSEYCDWIFNVHKTLLSLLHGSGVEELNVSTTIEILKTLYAQAKFGNLGAPLLLHGVFLYINDGRLVDLINV